MDKKEKIIEILQNECCSPLGYTADKILALDEVLSEGEIEKEIDFWLRHLVAKVTDEDDYVSIESRIEGHKKSIAQALSGRIAKPQPACSCLVSEITGLRILNKNCPIHCEKEKPRKIEMLDDGDLTNTIFQ